MKKKQIKLNEKLFKEIFKKLKFYNPEPNHLT